jgi:hypothetical protein
MISTWRRLLVPGFKRIQKNRDEEMAAAAARKRKDELDRAKLQAEIEARGEEEEVEEDEEEAVDPAACNLKLRLDGKNQFHDVTMHEDDPSSKVLEAPSVDARGRGL